MNVDKSNFVIIENPIIAQSKDDYMYHLGIDKNAIDIPKIYGDVKFICTGGSTKRFALYAETFAKENGYEISPNLCTTDRYIMYKTGPVLWVNHGIGNPSISIMLIEVVKLLHYAKATNVTAFRLGTSGGLGVDAGTVIISSGALNGELEKVHTQYIMGKKVLRSTILDESLKDDLVTLGKQIMLPVESGLTFCADDFYEGQARLDGAFCNYTDKDKFDFLRKLVSLGVRNIEMESTCFASICNRAGIKGAIVCVTIVNRMKGDQIKLDKTSISEYEMRPFKLVTSYMKKKLAKQ